VTEPFDVEITFKDLCAFVPLENSGVFLFPEVRRPRHWDRRSEGLPENREDNEPFHAHMPVVIIPDKSLGQAHHLQRLTQIRQCGEQTPKRDTEWLWFPSEADLHLETQPNPAQRHFKDEVAREEVCDFAWIYDKAPKPELDPVLIKPLADMTPKEKAILMERLNLRVFLDQGTLTHRQPEPSETWVFKTPGDEAEHATKRALADAFVLTLPQVTRFSIQTAPFAGKEEKLDLLPVDGKLSITLMNMTLEMYLGLNFGDEAFWKREVNRSKHFKLFFDLAKSWHHPRKIPHRDPPKSVEPSMPPEELFCPPLYFGN